MKKEKLQTRNSSLEFLKIIAMIIIILSHFVVHGIMRSSEVTTLESSWQFWLAYLLGWGGALGNYIFLLISGYFMIGKSINYKRILLLLLELFFYSWLILFVFYIWGIEPVTTKEIIKSIIPIWFGENWFVCCYIILCVFLPFINPFLNGLSKIKYLYLLILLLMFCLIIPGFKGNTFIGDSPLIVFFTVYATGGYIRKFDFSTVLLQHVSFWPGLVLVLSIMYVIVLAFYKLVLGDSNTYHFANVIGYFIAIAFFVSFVKKKSFYNKYINIIAKSVVGIYLIHDNFLVRKFVWSMFFPNIDLLKSTYFPLMMISKVVMVFIVCLMIDFLRIHLFEYCLVKSIDKQWEYWTEKIRTYKIYVQKLFDKI